jgi:hypothetical protein
MRTLTFEHDSIAGFAELLSSKNGTHEDVVKFSDDRRPIKTHPFGLDLPEKSRFGEWCAFLTHATDRSVGAMIAHLRWSLSAWANKATLKRLRIFNVQFDPDRPQDHYCYFEAWVGNHVYLCGDCTDCSGGGGSGNRRMRQVFTLLSSLYSVYVEEFEVMYEESKHLSHPELSIIQHA